ncbi:MAG: putative thiol:disulfide interchange protein DsbE [Myxococcales bacterium]|nr:putative thiol:disulfide interchange protein DsbE [Myxococcales bacterium]
MDQRSARQVVLAALLAAGAMSACATTGGAGEGGGKQVGTPAPELSVQSLSGKPLGLADYRGKVVLLDVWASWCGPCKQELPMLDDMAKRLRADGIEVLAVSIDQERANVTKFLKVRPHWSLTIAHDPKGQIADTLAPDKMPTSYVIDRAGTIRYVNSGFEPDDAREIERRLLEVAKR